jgi:signal transduction histidine kinase
MDGTLRVESEVGRGSTFTMTLPININQPEIGTDVLQKISR